MFERLDRTVSVWDGRGRDPAHDMALTQAMLRRCERDHGFAFLRISPPLTSVAFGSSDLVRAGATEAIKRANAGGLAATRRLVGGNAVVLDNGCLRVELGIGTPDPRTGLRDRFAFMSELIEAAVRSLGVDLVAGEPEHSYCPGEFSLMTLAPKASSGFESNARSGSSAASCSSAQGNARGTETDGGKVVGIAQRIVKGAALLSATITAQRQPSSVDVMTAVYDALGLGFSPKSVGQLGVAPSQVAQAIRTLATQRMDLTPWQPDGRVVALANASAGRFVLNRPGSG
ncbi:MAG: lipoate--protein ligase family protein [Actinobacteria bacterium]|nr:lipoate--protein ligase family protein [Actinomycetota bacterium]MCB9389388.1 lipoate--protein ligase family protein [Acidimicrobiia bacterium]